MSKTRSCLCLLLSLLVCCCSSNSRQLPAQETFAVMDTFASVRVRATDGELLRSFVSTTLEIMAKIENTLSIYKPDSEACRITAMAGIMPVPISESTWRLLHLSKKYATRSGGAFDITVAPLLPLWGFGKAHAELPSRELVISTLKRVGSKHLILSNATAYLELPDMSIDLGGIAKGYAVDLCCEALAAQGASNVLVNLGGNIRCLGMAGKHRPWRVAVRNPFDRNRLLGVLDMKHGEATATSGNYERFVEINGERYAHIINPKTGFPVKGMAGITVVCSNATEADAMSTAFFVLGMEDSRRLLAGTNGCAALFVPDKQPIEIWITSSFASYFLPLPELAERVFTIESADTAQRNNSGKAK